jgi:GNAT superfamily N-acetyltransferase
MFGEKRESRGKIALSKTKMKIMGFLKIVFGGKLAFAKMFLFETLRSEAGIKTVDRAKVSVRLAQRDDIPKLRKFKELAGTNAEERLKAGHLCFVAEKNGDIVSYTWVCFNEAFIEELDRRILIRFDSAYRYNDYTVPKFRGMGILPTVLMTASDYLFQHGIREIYDLVASNNLPSLRVYRKIGSRKMGEVTFIKLFDSRVYRCKAETARDYARLKEILSV